MKSSSLLKLFNFFALSASIYLVAWIITYLVFMQFDLRYVFDYFIKSWSGGFEMPAFIQMIALVVVAIFLFATGLWYVFKKHKRGHKD